MSEQQIVNAVVSILMVLTTLLAPFGLSLDWQIVEAPPMTGHPFVTPTHSPPPTNTPRPTQLTDSTELNSLFQTATRFAEQQTQDPQFNEATAVAEIAATHFAQNPELLLTLNAPVSTPTPDKAILVRVFRVNAPLGINIRRVTEFGRCGTTGELLETKGAGELMDVYPNSSYDDGRFVWWMTTFGECFASGTSQVPFAWAAPLR